MLRGLVRIVLIILATEESKKSIYGDWFSFSKYRNDAKQIQHPEPAFAMAAIIPLQNPLNPQLRQIYLEAISIFLIKLLFKTKSQGGSIKAILTFSKGCKIAVVHTPERRPQIPLSLIIQNLQFGNSQFNSQEYQVMDIDDRYIFGQYHMKYSIRYQIRNQKERMRQSKKPTNLIKKDHIEQLKDLMNSYFSAQNTKTMNTVLPQIQKVKSETYRQAHQLKHMLAHQNHNKYEESVKNWKQKETKLANVKTLGKQIQRKKKQLHNIKLKKQQQKRQLKQLFKSLKGLTAQSTPYKIDGDYNILSKCRTQSISDNIENSQLSKSSVASHPKIDLKESVLKDQTIQEQLKQIRQLVSQKSCQIQEQYSKDSLYKFENMLMYGDNCPISRKIFINYSANQYFNEKLKQDQFLGQLIRIAEL